MYNLLKQKVGFIQRGLWADWLLTQREKKIALFTSREVKNKVDKLTVHSLSRTHPGRQPARGICLL